MGAFHSRRNAGVEELDLSSSNAYRYPPKSGNFASLVVLILSFHVQTSKC